MIFVGIDVASNKHDIAITTLYGEILTECFTVPNNYDGFKKLHTEILSHTESTDDVRIGIEETGIYSQNIANFLALQGFTVLMLNPVLTSNSRKALSPRLTKTDKIDAYAICRYVESNYKRHNSYTPTLYISNELKSLSRARLEVQKKLNQAKTEWTRLLDITFPEFRSNFNQHSAWVYKLFMNYPTHQKISNMHLTTLESIVKVRGDRLVASKMIKALAKSSVGSTNITNSLLILSTLDDINHYQNQMNIFMKEIKAIVNEHFSFLLSIPGLGAITTGLIVGEIGDINQFQHPKSLLAFAGLDPTIYQSGNYTSQSARISKRGSRYLRTAIFTATKVAIINPKIKYNKFRERYILKTQQGKHHNSAICHAAKNMSNVIYTLLKSKQEFDYTI
ncbi:MAG: IS110 family transposase [Clostridiales bacterium]|nr:IS110 family transposase [Clostridiales bacterium]